MVFVINFRMVYKFKFSNWNVLASKADFIDEHFSSHNNRIAWNFLTGNVDISGYEIEVVHFDEISISDDFNFECFLCCLFYLLISS